MTDNNLLWHFTTTENLPKVLLEAPFLTAGHTAFLSDPEDSVLSRRTMALSVELLKALARVRNGAVVIPEKVAEKTVTLLKGGLVAPTFVLCLTDSVEDFRMWKAYTSNGGVAIGFDRAKLVAFLKGIGASVSKCFYKGYADMERMVDGFENDIRTIQKMADEGPSNNEDMEDFDILFENIAKTVKMLSEKLVFLKRERFRFEAETRIAFTLLNETSKVHQCFFGTRPRLGFDWSIPIKSFVQEIWISPLGDEEVTMSVAHLVAREIGLATSEVKTCPHLLFA